MKHVTILGPTPLRLKPSTFSEIHPQMGDPYRFIAIVPEILFGLPLILIGLPLLLVTLTAFVKSKITLTNRRLIFRTGFASRVAGELPLENVEAIVLVEPLLGRVVGYGTVVVTSLGGLRFPFRYLESAQDFHARLQKAVADIKSPGIPPPPPAPPAPGDDSRYMPK